MLRQPEVSLWMWHIPSLCEALAAALLPTLSQDEQALYHTIKSPRRRREYLAGHHLLRVALGQLLPDWADHHHFHMDDEHWLTLVGPLAEAVDFNLSHSGDWVACAVGWDCRVGVDIESPRKSHFYRALAAEYFSAREYQRLAALPDEPCRETFYELWTLKESYLKARKLGISAVELATEFVSLSDVPVEWYCYRFQFPQQQAGKVFGALTVSTPLEALPTLYEYTRKNPVSKPLAAELQEPLAPRQ